MQRVGPTFERIDFVILAAASIALLVALVWRGVEQHISFDESWHIYFATISDYEKLVKEIGRDLHPPTCSILLRPLVEIGPEAIWPRLLSIVPSALQPILWFWLLREVGVHRAICYASVFALCTSHAFLDFAIIVRGYALAQTAAMVAAIATARILTGRGSTKGAGWFAAVSIAFACWTEYSTSFALAALAGGLVLIGLVDRDTGRSLLLRAARTVRWPQLTLVIGAWVGVAAFYFATYGARALPHATEWFPEPAQSLSDYVVRGLSLNTYYFTPFDPRNSTLGAYGIVAAVGAAFGVGVRIAARGPDLAGKLRGAAILSLPLLVFGMALLGCLHKYPWGGFVRQQLVLVPFLHAALAIVAHEVFGHLGRRTWIVAAVIIAIATHTTLDSHANFDTHEVQPSALWQDALEQTFPADDHTAVCLPNCSFFGLAGAYRGRLDVEFDHEDREWDLYLAGTPRRTVLRPRFVWTIGAVPELEILTQLREQCDRVGVDRVRMMTMRFDGVPIAEREGNVDAVAAACSSAGFRVSEHRAWPEGETYLLTRVR